MNDSHFLKLLITLKKTKDSSQVISTKMNILIILSPLKYLNRNTKILLKNWNLSFFGNFCYIYLCLRNNSQFVSPPSQNEN